MRYLQDTPTNVRAAADAVWTRYLNEQRAARGLRATDSLDTRAGVPLPNAQAITTRYVDVRESSDRALAAIPLDDEPLATRARVSLAGALEENLLDSRLRSTETGTTSATADARVR